MKVLQLIELLNLTLAAGAKGVEKEITGGFAGDLLSEAIGRASEGEVWITIQTHKNVVAVASLKELSAVIIAQGHQVEDDVIEAADNENVPILLSTESAFALAGKLYKWVGKGAE
jgi:predicted transcriptional regulator